jgi:hypothetical protein
MTFRDTLGDESKSLDLGELQALKGAGVDATRTSKVNDNVDVRVNPTRPKSW